MSPALHSLGGCGGYRSMGSVEECGYGLAWDVNEIHMGDLCVCSGGAA